MRSSRLTAITAAAFALATPAAALAAPGDTTLVSRASGPAGAIASDSVFYAQLSGDASTVAFATEAENLSGFDDDGSADVFARSLATATTSLISAGENPVPFSPDVGGDDSSGSPAINGDGRFVAFSSGATNFSDDDEDTAHDVFVRDRLTGETELVSRDDGENGDPADADSHRPSISADGRFVAFESEATNLSNADEDGSTDIFVRDRQLHQTTLISHRNLNGGDDDSTHATISPDGDTIAFYSQATNLADNDQDAINDVFVGSIDHGTTELISRSTFGNAANAGPNTSAALALSADGNRVAFISDASNLAPGDGPSVDVFIRDRAAQTTTLGSPGNAQSFLPSLSADGTKLAFHSYADNLHPDDPDGTSDVFVRDLTTGETSLESRTSAGVKGDGPSSSVTISADGKTIAFRSTAANLGALFGGQTFVRELPQPAAPAGPAGPTGQPSGDPGTTPSTGATTTPKPKLRKAGRLALGKTGSRCISKKRLRLRLKLVGATPGVKIVRVQVRVGERTLRFKGTKPVVRKLNRTPKTIRITATTSLGTKVTLKKRFRGC
ncbi:MAG: PD40 domain-containing protein [Solirubrobacteraceae bacterium]|nr:PD40 domain-containing protein [Solirubrobacteraceae bacterium]